MSVRLGVCFSVSLFSYLSFALLFCFYLPPIITKVKVHYLTEPSASKPGLNNTFILRYLSYWTLRMGLNGLHIFHSFWRNWCALRSYISTYNQSLLFNTVHKKLYVCCVMEFSLHLTHIRWEYVKVYCSPKCMCTLICR